MSSSDLWGRGGGQGACSREKIFESLVCLRLHFAPVLIVEKVRKRINSS